LRNFRLPAIKETLFSYWFPAATGLAVCLLMCKRVALLKTTACPISGIIVLAFIGLGEITFSYFLKVLIGSVLLRDMVTKFFWGFALPLGALLLLGVPLTEMGLQTISFGPGRYARLGWTIALVMTMPLILHPQLRRFYFSRATWTWRWPVAMFGAYVYSWFVAALPEEFFFRQLLQPRLIQVSRSTMLGIALTSILFAFSHVPHYIKYYKTKWWLALVEAAFQQGPVGVLLGAIWIQTRGLSPVLFIHAWIDMLAFTPIAYRLISNTGDAQQSKNIFR
jgi:membrane protease YdiL (CAAX protease family)